MDCPECGGYTIGFRVPADLREHAPGEASSAAICSRCLSVTELEGDPPSDDPDFSRVADAFPEGEAGVAMAIALGLIVESVALNRDAVATLFERVRSGGSDPWLALERLEIVGSIEADADLERARRQLRQLLD